MPLHQIATNQKTGNAASGGSNSLVTLLQEKLPKCTLCSKCFTEPKQLDCSHSFCKECLKACAIVNRKLQCPSCETQTEVKQDICGLADNLLLKSIGEEFQDFQKKSIRCNNCENGISAEVACIDCSCYFCESCFKGHQSVKIIRESHKTFNIEAMTSLEKFQEFQKQKFAVCAEHKDNKKLFCVEDNLAICHTCTFTSEHKHHNVIAIEEHMKNIAPTIEIKTNAINEIIKSLKEGNYVTSDKLAHIKKKLQSSLDYLNKEEEAAIAMVKRKFAAIKKECADKFQQVIDTYESFIETNRKKISNMEVSLLEKDLFLFLPISTMITSASKYLENLNAIDQAPVLDVHSQVVSDVKLNKAVEISAEYIYEKPNYAHYKDGTRACIGDEVLLINGFSGTIINIQSLQVEVQLCHTLNGLFSLGHNGQYKCSLKRRK